MSSFSFSSDDEIRSRLDFVLSRLEKSLSEVSPFLLKIGTDREEAASLVEEMKKRGMLKEESGGTSTL